MIQKTTMRRYLSVNEMCVKLGCARSTIYRYEATGVIPPSFRIGSRRLWDDAEVDAYRLEARHAKQSAAAGGRAA